MNPYKIAFHAWMANMVLAGCAYYISGFPGFGLICLASIIGAAACYTLVRHEERPNN